MIENFLFVGKKRLGWTRIKEVVDKTRGGSRQTTKIFTFV